MFRLTLILLVLFTFTLPTLAQEKSVLCDVDNFTEEAIPVLQEWFDEIQQAVDDGDPDLALHHLRVLENRAAMFRSMCSAWVFNSDLEGLQPVIGPVLFLDGIYRARVTTENFIIVKITTIAGDCGRDGSIFNESKGEAIDGSEKVFETAEGCTALIEMSNISAPWTLEFELIKLNE